MVAEQLIAGVQFLVKKQISPVRHWSLVSQTLYVVLLQSTHSAELQPSTPTSHSSPGSITRLPQTEHVPSAVHCPERHVPQVPMQPSGPHCLPSHCFWQTH
jgi:hypothetical protein